MVPEDQMTERPDRIIAIIEWIDDPVAMQTLANQAVETAKQMMPKITGYLANSLVPVFGRNFWGIHFADKKAWFLERGTRPFTMNSLAGKTIPMWVDDPDGEVAKAEGKKAKTRVTMDGRKQTLIFRHAARHGQRKMIFRDGQWVSVPRSYPGAPGRIKNRASAGRIASGNVGVRWRHPGIEARHYLNRAMEQEALSFGIELDRIYLVDAGTYPIATKA